MKPRWSTAVAALSVVLLGACSGGGKDDVTTGGSSQILFAKSFGGDQSDLAAGVCKTADGGHLVGGYSSSFGFGDRDVLLTKVSGDGEVVWQRTLGTVDDAVVPLRTPCPRWAFEGAGTHAQGTPPFQTLIHDFLSYLRRDRGGLE